VAQKSSPAVRRAEGVFGIYEPRSHRDEARRVRDDLDKVVGGERGRVSVAALSSPARTGRAMWHRRAPSSALPRWGEGRAHSLKSRQGVAQDHKRGS